MSFYISNYELEKIIEEDVNPIDLTSELLNLDQYQAKINYKARHSMVVCCTEEAERICELFKINTTFKLKSGTLIKEGDIFFEAVGDADKIHMVWKTLLRIFEGFSAMASRTYEFVERVKKIDKKINVVTTRKNLAGTKKLALKAVIAGGAQPHRMGLSETILIFDQHLKFVKDDNELIKKLEEMKEQVLEKKIGIEAQNFEDAVKYVKMGFDFVQLDKFSPEEIKKLIDEAQKINENVVIVAAGGINYENAEKYAKSGVPVIVTSSLYFGKPSDIKATIEKVDFPK